MNNISIRITTLIIVILIFINPLFAKQITNQTARQVAKNFITEKSGLKYSEVTIREEFVIGKENIPVYFIFNINDGFIAISTDDAVFPVLAYSFKNNYTGEGFPDGFGFWMDNYAWQIQTAIKSKAKSSESVSSVWKKYLADDFTPAKSAYGVTPLLSTTWGQGCYYNTALPEEEQGPCGHLYTGCVATAMAQIMKYYNYPESGTGSYGYNTSYGYVEADFENTVYNWSEMENHLTDENEAVATLMMHCTISLSSQFFPEGTGAYDTTVPGALFKYFKYKPDAQFYFRDEYTGDWKALLRSELDEHRPLLYGGVTESNYGHTLVCDGYQDTAFFHFNWGSGGNYDGYFYLDTLTAAGLNFNKLQDAVVGIEPAINSVSETNNPFVLSVYPNPSKGDLFIKLKENSGKNIKVSLLDLSGKEIIGKNVSVNDEGNINLKFPGLTGTFLLYIVGCDIKYSTKIVLLNR